MGAPLEPRVSLITLGVADLQRARAFYEGLGWEASPKSVDGEVAFFQLGPLVLGLWSSEALAADADVDVDVDVDAGSAGFRGVALAHNVRSRGAVAAALRRAEAAGGRVVRAAEDTDWGGHSGYFSDPDGHLWEVAWNPHGDLAADGAFRI